MRLIFYNFEKEENVCCTIVVAVTIQSLVLDKLFLLNYLLERLLLKGMHHESPIYRPDKRPIVFET